MKVKYIRHKDGSITIKEITRKVEVKQDKPQWADYPTHFGKPLPKK